MLTNAVKLETNIDDFSIISQDCISAAIQKIDKLPSLANGEATTAPKQSGVIRLQRASKKPEGRALTLNKKKPIKEPTSHSFETEISSNQDPKNTSVVPTKNDYVARVTMSDCLSCSGCATTSELIFKQQQSIDQFLIQLKEKSFSVISISPQSRTALARYFDVSDQLVMRKLSWFFHFIGFDYVFDMSLSESIAILESQKEFLSSYNKLPSTTDTKTKINNDSNVTASSATRKLPLICSHCPSWVLYAQKNIEQNLFEHISKVRSSQQIQGILVKSLIRDAENKSRMKMYHLATRCPSPLDFQGFIQYKKFFQKFILTNLHHRRPSKHKLVYNQPEGYIKDNDADVLNQTNLDPHNLSSASTSEYAIESHSDTTEEDKFIPFSKEYMGYLQPDDIFHVCIMPCYDKKVEAARPEINLKSDSHNSNSDVNIVIITSEILELFAIYDMKFEDLPERNTDHIINASTFSIFSPEDIWANHTLWDISDKMPIRISHNNSTNGGYAERLFRFAAKTLYGVEMDHPLEFKTYKDQNFKEISLEVEGKVVLKFAISYGLKNITRIVKGLANKSSSAQNSSYKSTSIPNLNDYDYIELMACPRGCLNGGGQSSLYEEVLSNERDQDTKGLFNNSNRYHIVRKEKSFMDDLEKSLHSDSNTQFVKPEEYPYIYPILSFLSQKLSSDTSLSKSNILSPWLSVNYQSLKSSIDNSDLMKTHLTNIQW